jgi:hypothetical protein
MEFVYSEHIEASLENANRYISKCPTSILEMDGMSGKKTRHFYNNICSIPDCKYLEIGTWHGSSLCSAVYGNNLRSVVIDNWSYHTGDRDIFLQNISQYRGLNAISVVEKDCWNVSTAEIGMKCNVYLYDGDHTSESHRRALTHFINSMDDTFIYIVDDWNDLRVRVGTLSGIAECRLRICYHREIYTTHDNTHPVIHGPNSEWHNGMSVFVLSK